MRNRENPWTPEQMATLREMYYTHKPEQIAVKIGRTVSAVRSRANSMGLKKTGWTKEQDNWLRKNYKKMDFIDLFTSFKQEFDVNKTHWSLISKLNDLKKRFG